MDLKRYKVEILTTEGKIDTEIICTDDFMDEILLELNNGGIKIGRASVNCTEHDEKYMYLNLGQETGNKIFLNAKKLCCINFIPIESEDNKDKKEKVKEIISQVFQQINKDLKEKVELEFQNKPLQENGRMRGELHRLEKVYSDYFDTIKEIVDAL